MSRDEPLTEDMVWEILRREFGSEGRQLQLPLFPEPEMSEDEIIESCRQVRREIFGETYPELAGHYST